MFTAPGTHSYFHNLKIEKITSVCTTMQPSETFQKRGKNEDISIQSDCIYTRGRNHIHIILQKHTHTHSLSLSLSLSQNIKSTRSNMDLDIFLMGNLDHFSQEQTAMNVLSSSLIHDKNHIRSNTLQPKQRLDCGSLCTDSCTLLEQHFNVQAFLCVNLSSTKLDPTFLLSFFVVAGLLH